MKVFTIGYEGATVDAFLSALTAAGVRQVADIRAIAASHLSFKYQELRQATDEFNQINKLGQGGYGSVYKVF